MDRGARGAIITVTVIVAAMALATAHVNKGIRSDIAALDNRITDEEAARITAGADLERGIADVSKTLNQRCEEQDNASNALKDEIKALESRIAALEPPEEEEEAKVEETSSGEVDTSGWQYIGVKKLTAYEETGHNTASGVYPIEDESCASNELPFGTRLYIEGYGFWTVHDRGNMPWADLDLYLRTYERCVQFGERTANVWIVK